MPFFISKARLEQIKAAARAEGRKKGYEEGRKAGIALGKFKASFHVEPVETGQRLNSIQIESLVRMVPGLKKYVGEDSGGLPIILTPKLEKDRADLDAHEAAERGRQIAETQKVGK